jgi:hypothetical protein
VGKEDYMIGQIHFVGGSSYVQVNEHGTLEKLPGIPWYRQLRLYWLNRYGRLHLQDVREAWK